MPGQPDWWSQSKIDIIAQDLTELDIEIIAWSAGVLQVDIVAQTIGDIGIDIAGQSLGDITIEITAQSIGVYLQPDWQALQGTDKNLVAVGSMAAKGATVTLTYSVPSGKTLYICSVCFSIFASLTTDAELNQMGYLYIYNQTDGITYAIMGGNGGGGLSYPKPIRIPSNKSLNAVLVNNSNHACTGGVTVLGYEI